MGMSMKTTKHRKDVSGNQIITIIYRINGKKRD